MFKGMVITSKQVIGAGFEALLEAERAKEPEVFEQNEAILVDDAMGFSGFLREVTENLEQFDRPADRTVESGAQDILNLICRESPPKQVKMPKNAPKTTPNVQKKINAVQRPKSVRFTVPEEKTAS